MMFKKYIWLLHSGLGKDFGGIERVNSDVLAGWKTVSDRELVSFQPTKSISSVLSYVSGCFDSNLDTILFMHLGLTKFLLFGRNLGKVKVFLHGIEAWRVLPWWHKRVLRKVDHFLTNSQFTWDRFLYFNPEFAHVKHDVVHLGIGEPTDYVEPDSEVAGALIIGRMSKSEDYKGHRELISVWPQVRQQVPNAELWIVGTGDLQPELERLAKVQEGIRFFGKVSEEKKQELLRRCRCLAMPSRNEGFGLVYLEAMRLGRPCLVSDCDAGREVVGQCGIEVDSNDSEKLCDNVVRLLVGGKIGNTMGKVAHRLYGERFTSNKFLARFSEAINS